LARTVPPRSCPTASAFFPKKTLTGIYDTEILCEACDGELGKLDQHAVENVCRASDVVDLKDGGQTIARQYPSADGELVGRFIASVLWRASISRHYFFNRVDLGPYEEIIRDILSNRSQDSGRIQMLLAEFNKADVPILNPHKTRTDEVGFWVIYANRFIMYTKTDRQRTPDDLSEFVLRKERVVTSIVRSWEGSKEDPLIAKIAAANPGAFGKAP
jgi:hypothetical protein